MNEKENRNKEDSVAKVICHAQCSAKKKLLGKNPGSTCKKNPHVIVSATEINPILLSSRKMQIQLC